MIEKNPGFGKAGWSSWLLRYKLNGQLDRSATHIQNAKAFLFVHPFRVKCLLYLFFKTHCSFLTCRVYNTLPALDQQEISSNANYE